MGAAARLLRALEEEKRFSEREFFWKIAHEEGGILVGQKATTWMIARGPDGHCIAETTLQEEFSSLIASQSHP